MGTQVLAGSIGVYNKPVDPKIFGDTTFVVTHDTCMEAEKLPIKFTDATESCWVFMRNVTLTNSKTKDY